MNRTPTRGFARFPLRLLRAWRSLIPVLWAALLLTAGPAVAQDGGDLTL